MKQVLGIGNALVDALICIPNDNIINEFSLAKGGMTLINEAQYKKIALRIENMEKTLRTGGSAGNALLAVAALGGAAAFIGKRGRDANGLFYAQERAAQGVTPIALYHEQLPTGVAHSFISPDGQRTFATYLGAAVTMTAEELRPTWFEGASFFFIEGYLVQNHHLIEAAVDYARAAGAKVCLDLASWNIVEAELPFFRHLLSKTDIVFANEEEVLAMTGKAGEQALEALAAQCPTAIVKLGAKGAIAQQGAERVEIPATACDKVVDTTGAGDFFAGGFLYQQAMGRSLHDSLRLGAACAAAVIQVVGTKLDETTWQHLRALAQ